MARLALPGFCGIWVWWHVACQCAALKTHGKAGSAVDVAEQSYLVEELPSDGSESVSEPADSIGAESDSTGEESRGVPKSKKNKKSMLYERNCGSNWRGTERTSAQRRRDSACGKFRGADEKVRCLSKYDAESNRACMWNSTRMTCELGNSCKDELNEQQGKKRARHQLRKKKKLQERQEEKADPENDGGDEATDEEVADESDSSVLDKPLEKKKSTEADVAGLIDDEDGSEQAAHQRVSDELAKRLKKAASKGFNDDESQEATRLNTGHTSNIAAEDGGLAVEEAPNERLIAEKKAAKEKLIAEKKAAVRESKARARAAAAEKLA